MRLPHPVDDNKKPIERAKAAWPEARRLLRPYRGLLVGGLALVLITRLCSLVLPLAPQVLIDSVIQKGKTGLLLPLIGAVVVTSVVQALLSITLARVFARAAQGLTVELRCRVQKHVLHLPLAYHDQHRVGTLVQRTMSDVQGIQNFLGQTFLGFFGAVLTAVIAYGIMLYMNLRMTLVATVMIIVFSFVVSNVSRRLRPIARRRAMLFAEISGRLTEAYGGVRVVKGYRGEEREQVVYRKGVEQIKGLAVRSVMLSNLMGVAAILTLGIAGATLIYIGAQDMMAHTMTIGQFVSYSSLMGFLAQPVQQMVTLGQQIPEGLAGIDRMQELLANPREDLDTGRKEPIGPIEGRVAFEDLRFAYEAGEPVLKGLTFEAAPGTVTAFVGPSGSGKSTAINLIAAFYKATGGKVLVDGVDLSTVTLDSYRAQLGLVLQETFLFDGTILENVAFSRPEATREEILEACKRARVDEFATRLEKGWETRVGERGVKLSGGQRQRISIARALLANPRILILDEATSALDTQSEQLIQEALEDLMRGRTTFVIAHRLSTIRKADQILVVERGEITERGKHDELLAAEGRYWQMYTQQHAGGLLLGAGESASREDDGGAALEERAPVAAENG